MLLEHQGTLLHQIKKWCELQTIYMPGVVDPSAPDPESSQREKAEAIKLWLPSQLENVYEHASFCVPGIINSEKEL